MRWEKNSKEEKVKKERGEVKGKTSKNAYFQVKISKKFAGGYHPLFGGEMIFQKGGGRDKREKIINQHSTYVPCKKLKYFSFKCFELSGYFTHFRRRGNLTSTSRGGGGIPTWQGLAFYSKNSL